MVTKFRQKTVYIIPQKVILIKNVKKLHPHFVNTIMVSWAIYGTKQYKQIRYQKEYKWNGRKRKFGGNHYCEKQYRNIT